MWLIDWLEIHIDCNQLIMLGMTVLAVFLEMHKIVAWYVVFNNG